MTGTPSLLGYGVDTAEFWLSWGPDYNLPKEFVTRLDTHRASWLEDDQDGAVFWGIDSFLPVPTLQGDGSIYEAAEVRNIRHFRWALIFQGGRVVVRLADPRPTTRKTGAVQMMVELSGSYMRNQFGGDLSKAVLLFADLLGSLVGAPPSVVNLSRVDIYADVRLDKSLTLQDLDLFVSRSRSRTVYGFDEAGRSGGTPPGGPLSASPMGNTGGATYGGVEYTGPAPEEFQAYLRGRDWSGFRFGAGPLLARVYSKSVEAKTKSEARALLDSYGKPDGHVVRVEFQLRAEALASFTVDGSRDLRGALEFAGAIPEVWAYLTGEWLTHRSPSPDSNRWRWAFSTFWEVVKSAFPIETPSVAHRLETAPRYELQQLYAQLQGLMLTITAMTAQGVNTGAAYAAYVLRKVTNLTGLSFDWHDMRKRFVLKRAVLAGCA